MCDFAQASRASGSTLSSGYFKVHELMLCRSRLATCIHGNFALQDCNDLAKWYTVPRLGWDAAISPGPESMYRTIFKQGMRSVTLLVGLQAVSGHTVCIWSMDIMGLTRAGIPNSSYKWLLLPS